MAQALAEDRAEELADRVAVILSEDPEACPQCPAIPTALSTLSREMLAEAVAGAWTEVCDSAHSMHAETTAVLLCMHPDRAQHSAVALHVCAGITSYSQCMPFECDQWQCF